jgi:hypothetical protein
MNYPVYINNEMCKHTNKFSQWCHTLRTERIYPDIHQDSKLFSATDTICVMDGPLLDHLLVLTFYKQMMFKNKYMNIKYHFSHAFVRQSTK